MPDQIPFFEPGNVTRTPMHAGAINEIVAIANLVAAMRGTRGVKVVIADAGIVIELSDDLQKRLGMNTGQPGDIPKLIRWRGLWDATVTDYEKNDIVLLRPASPDGTNAGTFIARTDTVPVGEEPFLQSRTVDLDDTDETTYWEPFALFAGEFLSLAGMDDLGPTDYYIDLSAQSGVINMEAPSKGNVTMTLTALGAVTGSGGKDIQLREIQVCVDVAGTPTLKKMIVLCSEPFT